MPTSPVPQYCPTPVEVDDLELLTSGALGDPQSFNQPGSPVTLTLPEPLATQASQVGAVELIDPEGLPLARVSWPQGAVEPLVHAEYGPFRALMLSPSAYRQLHAGRTIIPVSEALTTAQLEELRDLGPVTLLTWMGTGAPHGLSPVGVVRATRAAARLLPDAVVVTVPLAAHGDPDADRALSVQVVRAFASEDPIHELSARAPEPPLVDPVETAAAGRTYPREIQHVVDQDRPPPDRQGLVVFFTGLSGSGKSTLARTLVDLLLEHGERTVTSLDGDVVRRNLSAGLTFSKEDRETNIRRIGWVAAEISRHGGVAVVSPIAPFDETRQQVRAMVENAAGAFFLVHVATPLEECERRDRKGLYAKARAGEIPEFTGISSPYEEPHDADVRVDTTGRSVDDALHDVLVALKEAGYLDLLHGHDLPTPAQSMSRKELTIRRSNPSSARESNSPTSHQARDGDDPDSGRSSLSRFPQPGRDRNLATVVEARGPRPSLETTTADADALRPFRVLFVCTANICRSPSIELLAKHAIGEATDVVFSSAGTHATDGSPINPEQATALPAKIDSSTFRSRRLTGRMLAEADLVLTMESAHRSFILDDNPQMFRTVFTLGQFAQAVERAPEGLVRREVLVHVAETRGNADPALDVPDPYRRGAEAATACVDRLAELLRVVLPALTPEGAAHG